MKEKNITMRTIGLIFLLVALALSPAVFADAGRNDQPPVNGNHHNAVAPHMQPADTDRHELQGHPHKHSLMQWLHNVLFGQFHHDDAHTVPLNATPGHDHHNGNAGEHVLPYTHTDHGAKSGHHDSGYHPNVPVEHDPDCTGIR
jgi:hypothetical protein